MSQVSKLFLLLITCVMLSFACTSGNKKSPTVPTVPIGGGNQSQQMKELRDKLNDRINTLQSQVGQGKVSQEEFEEIQDELKTVQEELKEADGGRSEMLALQEQVKELEDLAKEYEKRVNSMEEKLDKQKVGDASSEDGEAQEAQEVQAAARGSTEQTQTGTTEQAHTETAEAETNDDEEAAKDEGEPTITIAMRELKEKTTGTITDGEGKSTSYEWIAGTYVTFSSDKDVVIEAIKYGKLTFTPDQDSSGQAFDDTPTVFNIKLPVYVKFTHANTPYCVTATIDRYYLPGIFGDKEALGTMTKHEMPGGRCGP